MTNFNASSDGNLSDNTISQITNTPRNLKLSLVERHTIPQGAFLSYTTSYKVTPCFKVIQCGLLMPHSDETSISTSSGHPGLSLLQIFPDSKVHGTNMGPIWGRQDPGGPHVGPMNLAIWVGDGSKPFLEAMFSHISVMSNKHHNISNYSQLRCLFYCFILSALCHGNSPVIGGYKASNVENISRSWCLHDIIWHLLMLMSCQVLHIW